MSQEKNEVKPYITGYMFTEWKLPQKLIDQLDIENPNKILSNCAMKCQIPSWQQPSRPNNYLKISYVELEDIPIFKIHDKWSRLLDSTDKESDFYATVRYWTEDPQCTKVIFERTYTDVYPIYDLDPQYSSFVDNIDKLIVDVFYNWKLNLK